jgi:succinate dehydrogenase / fumarate reductase, iron-sulfur subunit
MGTKRQFRVWRGDETGGKLEDFQVEVNEGEVVLDVIHRLQATQAPDLAVRWNCKAGKCGSCSMEINGMPRLGCMTRMSTFAETEVVTVSPIRTFPVIRDLVTDVSFNYTKAREMPAFAPPAGVAPGGYRMQQVDVERSQEFRKCIECFLCQNVCHVIRDHEENKPAFAGPRFFIRAAELDMHPLDARGDRKEMAQKEQGIGYCNITKCCTEVCPEHIKITDNAIIPMKERVVDRRFDPIVRLGRKIFRRDQLDDPASWPDHLPAGSLAMSGSTVPSGEEAAAAGVHASTTTEWHHQTPLPQDPALGPDGRLPVSEVAMDRSGAASPYGDDVTFPLPPEELSYRHPDAPDGSHR